MRAFVASRWLMSVAAGAIVCATIGCRSHTTQRGTIERPRSGDDSRSPTGLFEFRSDEFELSFKSALAQLIVGLEQIPGAHQYDPEWSVIWQYSISDTTRRRSFRRLRSAVVSEARDEHGNDLTPHVAVADESRENKGRPRAFSALWGSRGEGYHPGLDRWPPHFDGSIKMRFAKLPDRIAILRGHQDLEVLLKSRVVEYSIAELEEGREIAPGVQVRAVLPVQSRPHQKNQFQLKYEVSTENLASLDAINAMLVIDENGGESAQPFARVEEVSNNVVTGLAIASTEQGAKASSVKFHLVDETQVIRIPFAIESFPLREHRRQPSE